MVQRRDRRETFLKWAVPRPRMLRCRVPRARSATRESRRWSSLYGCRGRAERRGCRGSALSEARTAKKAMSSARPVSVSKRDFGTRRLPARCVVPMPSWLGTTYFV